MHVEMTSLLQRQFDLHFRLLLSCVPEVYFYYFHCEGERKIKPLVESGNCSLSRANQFELGSDPDSVS
jgi:hypothetical protein